MRVFQNKQIKELLKDEDIIYPTELDKCLAEINKSNNDIYYKPQL